MADSSNFWSTNTRKPLRPPVGGQYHRQDQPPESDPEAVRFFDALLPKKRGLSIKEVAVALFGDQAEKKMRNLRRWAEEHGLGYKIGKNWMLDRVKLLAHLANPQQQLTHR